MTLLQDLKPVFDDTDIITATHYSHLPRVSSVVETRMRRAFAPHIKRFGIHAVKILPLPGMRDASARVLILLDQQLASQDQRAVALLAHSALVGHYRPAEICIIKTGRAQRFDMADHLLYEGFHESQYFGNPSFARKPWACSIGQRYPSCYIPFK